jgi:hypothetical protein
MSSFLPILLVGVISLYALLAAHWGSRRYRSSQMDWNLLVASIRPNGHVEEIVPGFRWSEKHVFEQDHIWKRLQGAQGLWDIYHNAGVYVRLADFALASGAQIPESVIEQIHSDALQLRVCILLAISQYVVSRTVASSIHCSKALTLYCGIAARLTAAFQNFRPELFPDLMEAM